MPILNYQSPLIASHSGRSIVTPLPDLGSIQETFDQGAVKTAEVRWQNQAITSFNQSSQLTLSGTLESIGIPAGGTFNQVASFLEMDPIALQVGRTFWDLVEAANLDDLLEDALEQLMELAMVAMEEVFGALIDIVGVIPVYGWIVKAVWNVAMGIKSIVDIAKESNKEAPETEYPRAQFSPAADQLYANEMLLAYRSLTDWSSIFRPPGVGRNKTWGDRFFSAKLEGGGRRIATAGIKAGTAGSIPWIGFVPGTTMVHRAFEIEPDGHIIRDLGRLYPSVRDQGISLWGQVIKNSPTMFTMNPEDISSVWQQYLFDLRIWIKETDRIGSDTKKRFVNNYEVVSMFGWGPYDMPFDKNFGYENFGINDPAEMIKWKRNSRQTGVAVPVHNLDILLKRQHAYVNSITCAYLDESFGAFQGINTNAFKAKWDERRQQLLAHPAKCQVDLNNIPDEWYKIKMEEAQVVCGGMHIQAAPGFNVPKDVPAPSGEPADLPNTHSVGRVLARYARARKKKQLPESFFEKNKVALGALVLAVGAGTYYYKKRKK